MKILPPVSIEARRLLPSRWDLLAAGFGAGLHRRFLPMPQIPGPPAQFHHRPRPAAGSQGSPGYAPAHQPAHVDRHGRVIGLHLHLRDPGPRRTRAPHLAGAAAGQSCNRCRSFPSCRSPSCGSCRCRRTRVGRGTGLCLSPSSPARPGTWPSASIRACVPCRPELEEADGCSASMLARFFWRIEAPFATPPLIWNMMMQCRAAVSS